MLSGQTLWLILQIGTSPTLNSRALHENILKVLMPWTVGFFEGGFLEWGLTRGGLIRGGLLEGGLIREGRFRVGVY